MHSPLEIAKYYIDIGIHKTMLSAFKMVLLGFFAGMFIAFAGIASTTASSTIAVASRTGLSFADSLIRGILCNILVCLAVWMSFASKTVSGKLMISFWPVMLFVLCGFEHSIADMYFCLCALFTSAEYGITADTLTWGNFITHNLIPVTIGNLIGGVGIGFGYWLAYLHQTPYTHTSVESEQEDIDIAEEY